MPFADSTTPPPAWVGGSSSVPSPPDPEADPRTRGSEPDPHDWARQIVLRQLTAAPRSRARGLMMRPRKAVSASVAAAIRRCRPARCR